MAHTEIKVLVQDELKEIIMAELGQIGYEGFWEEGNELRAYITPTDFDHKRLYYTLSKYKMENHMSYQLIEDQNWNKLWEENYDPITIENKVHIRSPFHSSTNHPYELIIQPQMSFGTGHHETTELMIQMMLTHSFKDKKVLDMGTGTGVLAIFAEKLGASQSIGIDNHPSSVENAEENLKYNSCVNVSFLEGSYEAIPKIEFDIVLSNITKNINLQLLPFLASSVSNGGSLILAGFLNFDLKEVNEAVIKLGFGIERNISKGDWECLLYNKKQNG